MKVLGLQIFHVQHLKSDNDTTVIETIIKGVLGGLLTISV